LPSQDISVGFTAICGDSPSDVIFGGTACQSVGGAFEADNGGGNPLAGAVELCGKIVRSIVCEHWGQ
jgi:hypothetical protein